jgi:hypothetical protein
MNQSFCRVVVSKSDELVILPKFLRIAFAYLVRQEVVASDAEDIFRMFLLTGNEELDEVDIRYDVIVADDEVVGLHQVGGGRANDAVVVLGRLDHLQMFSFCAEIASSIFI